MAVTIRDPGTGEVATLSMEEVRERLPREMLADTLEHVYRTAKLARTLAEAHRVDPDRAELAALLHDIADRYSDRELLVLAERYGILIDLTEARVPKLIHGKVGAEILRREWGITDDEVLDAVRYHLSGAPTMSPLVKVVFVADKLEPHRDEHLRDLDPVRELAMVDLDAAMLKLYGWRMNQLVTSGKPIHEDLAQARNALIERAIATWGALDMEG